MPFSGGNQPEELSNHLRIKNHFGGILLYFQSFFFPGSFGQHFSESFGGQLLSFVQMKFGELTLTYATW
jgi:hypothetical protein